MASEAAVIVAASPLSAAGESMTWRNILMVCLVSSIAPVAPAAAQSPPQHAVQQDAPFEAATVREFLASCDRDASQCTFKLRMTLLNKLATRDATSVCVKDVHTQEPVIAWLKAHPETHAMATEDGIYAAYKSLYPCP